MSRARLGDELKFRAALGVLLMVAAAAPKRSATEVQSLPPPTRPLGPSKAKQLRDKAKRPGRIKVRR